MTAAAEQALRRLTLGDPRLLAGLADPARLAGALPRPDPRTEALLTVAALVAVDAPASSYRGPVDAALRWGATLDDLVGVVAAVAATVGSARVVSAAPRIALAAGYDVDAALERTTPPDGR